LPVKARHGIVQDARAGRSMQGFIDPDILHGADIRDLPCY